eukprot:COSAG05_NODE_2895_length_2530_cov_2.067873_3_plen_191_part_00
MCFCQWHIRLCPSDRIIFPASPSLLASQLHTHVHTHTHAHTLSLSLSSFLSLSHSVSSFVSLSMRLLHTPYGVVVVPLSWLFLVCFLRRLHNIVILFSYYFPNIFVSMGCKGTFRGSRQVEAYGGTAYSAHGSTVAELGPYGGCLSSYHREHLSVLWRHCCFLSYDRTAVILPVYSLYILEKSNCAVVSI